MPVFLIGAGPGDPGLITCKGREILARAEVVVYDYLASERLLSFARPDAELIYVGKKAGLHEQPQEEINRILVQKAREGKVVARLKGGDPYIFGRGGEEAEFLADAGLDFEEVPGVSSAVAAPAYAGIPLTHRAYSSSVTIITGHENPDKNESAHNWPALAQSGATLVFVMGVKNLEAISRNLIAGGLAPDTPAALIQWGTTGKQRSLAADLAHLPAEARAGQFASPSVIVVGQVVKLRAKLAWFEKRPLFGKNIAVTRSREQASAQSRLLEDLGANVQEFPCLRVNAPERNPELDAALDDLPAFDWLVFTSQNAVKVFFDRLGARGKDARALAGLRLASIGTATSLALGEHGLRPDYQPGQFVAESLAEGLAASGVQGAKILLPQARAARPVLTHMLTAAGASVTAIPIYSSGPDAEDSKKMNQALRDGQIDCVTFASSSTVDNFFRSVGPIWGSLPKKPALACIGPVTAATLADYGQQADIMPERALTADLAQAIAEYFLNRNKDNL